MEHGGNSLESLILVVSVSFLVPIILYKLRLKLLPVVVAEIIAGLIIGKSGFDLVDHDDSWLTLLSLLGFIYLMFLTGLEINFDSFRKKKTSSQNGFNPLSASVVIFMGIFLVSGAFSYGLVTLGLIDRPFLMTLIIGTISLGVVVPVLKERRILNTELGQTLLLISVIADFVTMILLAVYVSILSENVTRLLFLVLFFVLVAVIFWLIKRFASRKAFETLSQGTAQFATRAVFALMLSIVLLSESLGVENILGAFLAGVMVSLLRPKEQFVHQLESFGYGFLIPIFFVMVGVNLELGPLLTDPRILILIPLLLLLIFLSKLIPMLYLKRWYPWRQVLSSGVLLATTLSLVIAASTLALEMNMIDESLHGALILVAIVSCLIFPVVYNKMSPREAVRKKVIHIVGVNHVSMSVVHDLIEEGEYDVRLFTSSTSNTEEAGAEEDTEVKIHKLPNLDEHGLDKLGVFDADMVVLVSTNDELNLRIARYVSGNKAARVIVRIENPELQQAVQKEGLEVFSTLFASRTVLRTLIESPGALRLISERDDTIHEISVNNPNYHEQLLSDFPLLRDILILRIYRGDSFIIPHGNTEIHQGDKLLISGDTEQAEAFRALVE
ncbi:monovalent cation:proton antiporter family protein [Paenibacillus alkalitolerans]|uniref:monovalent cation:proton antiporter family protein n=1 Tax=Paenibacillus alkalitolerans TaxID=2799335 RepID=UPI0018F3E8D1|nr:cation:proton antiporter [Paenibacillus alkalitolerans]